MDASTPIDIEKLRAWIGRTETRSQVVTPDLCRAFLATLNIEPGEPAEGDTVLPCLHWCLMPPIVPLREIGPDGHPAKGQFLPPVPLPRRMWAGGQLQFGDPIRIGDRVTRISSVVDVTLKEGRAGALCFVTVEHHVTTPRGIAVTERQDIVYRGATAVTASTAAIPAAAVREGGWKRSYDATPVLLFRYSALTFNGHRIHYDRAYAQNEEGYPGLVVHGPLQATLLVTFATEIRGRQPSRFEFRGTSPLFDRQPFTVNAAEAEGGLELWVANQAGGETTKARAWW